MMVPAHDSTTVGCRIAVLAFRNRFALFPPTVSDFMSPTSDHRAVPAKDNVLREEMNTSITSATWQRETWPTVG